MMSYRLRLGERAAREAVEDGVGISGEQEEARAVMRRRVQLHVAFVVVSRLLQCPRSELTVSLHQ